MSSEPLHTRKEIASRPDAASDGLTSPLGDRLYKPTCTIRLRSPLNRASGTHREAGVVHSMRGDKCVIRRQETPDDPRTPGQLRRRATLGEISARWHTLPAEVREAWKAFADDQLAGYLSPFCKPGNRGQNAWGGAQIYRLGMGLGFCETAPSTLPPAGQITTIEELPPLSPGSFRFRLTHDVAATQGLRVLFQITRPLASPRRKARENQFVWAAQSDTDSFLPLAAGGAEYEIASPAVEVPAGASYAVRVRLVSEDGFRGVPTTVYLGRAGAPAPDLVASRLSVAQQSAPTPEPVSSPMTTPTPPPADDIADRYAPPVQQLLTLGESAYPAFVDSRRFKDYKALGLGPDHVPDLLRMAGDNDLLKLPWEDPRGVAPWHARRALAQLGSTDGLELLFRVMEAEAREDELSFASDQVNRETLHYALRLGPPAVPVAKRLLSYPERPDGVRCIAADILGKTGAGIREMRKQCRDLLMEQLAACDRQSPRLNGELVCALLDLRAAEALPLITGAFEKNLVDETLVDWTSVQDELDVDDPHPGKKTRSRSVRKGKAGH